MPTAERGGSQLIGQGHMVKGGHHVSALFIGAFADAIEPQTRARASEKTACVTRVTAG